MVVIEGRLGKRIFGNSKKPTSVYLWVRTDRRTDNVKTLYAAQTLGYKMFLLVVLPFQKVCGII